MRYWGAGGLDSPRGRSGDEFEVARAVGWVVTEGQCPGLEAITGTLVGLAVLRIAW